MKSLRAVIVLVVLFLIPFAARLGFFYRGVYQPSPVPRPSLSELATPPRAEKAEFVESATESKAVVVFDFAHDNNFKEAELNVLLSRLAVRGAKPEYLMPEDRLDRKLCRAQGFVVISPKKLFSNDEIRQVRHFVQTGGKLLLVTDPTRFETIFDQAGFPTGRRSDAAVMNILSASFGIVFQDDFLYNMVHNAGTFHDIKLVDFADLPLTQGLEEVIFFAAHSITTSGKPVIKADAETRSSLTERQGGLIVAALSNDDRVLGVSDWTFLTEPYSSQASNDRLISNIADFLVTGSREYTLADFPYFFGDHVDLRYAGKEAVGGEVLARAGVLQNAFDAVGKKLMPRKSSVADSDVLFIGLYDGLDYVQDYLTTRQISITLESKTEPSDESNRSASESGTPTETPRPTASASATLVAEPTGSYSDTLQADLEQGPAATETPTPSLKGTVSVADLGEFPTDTVTLISLGKGIGPKVMIVLAASESALAEAMGILAAGDLSKCLTGEESALCPSAPVEGTTVVMEPTSDFYLPPPEPEIPMTPTLEFIEPVEPPLLPD